VNCEIPGGVRLQADLNPQPSRALGSRPGICERRGMLTDRPARLPTFTYTGCHRYFLTFCTHNRAPLFVSAEHMTVVLGQFVHAAQEQQFAIPAYCFMPDHVHLLTEGLEECACLKSFVKLAKQYSGFHFRQRFGVSLWQRYLYEHVVRDDERTETIAAYIVENPLRARLVERIQDYPFVGSCTMTREELFASVSAIRSRSA
jgi:putative transposase